MFSQRTAEKVKRGTSLLIEQRPIPFSAAYLFCDVSTNHPRPYAPPIMRRQIFDHFHSMSHPGRKASTKLISERFVWPNMSAGIKYWTHTCIKCQRSKVQQHTRSPPGHFSAPDGRFKHIHVDLVGPLMEVDGYQYLLTIVDRFTRWPVVVPLRSTTASVIAQTILREWIATFGCPSVSTTHRGPQFQSTLFPEFTNLLGTKHITTTAYHPCANGSVERFHRQLKAARTASEDTRSWIERLPLVMLALRSVVKEDLKKCTTAELVFGSPPTLPGQMMEKDVSTRPSTYFIQDLKERVSNLVFTPTRTSNRAIFVPRTLENCEFVFLRRDAIKKPLTQTYSGPFQVISRAPKYFTILNLDQ